MCEALLCSCKAVGWEGHNTFVLGAVQRAPQPQVICNAVWHKVVLFFLSNDRFVNNGTKTDFRSCPILWVSSWDFPKVKIILTSASLFRHILLTPLTYWFFQTLTGLLRVEAPFSDAISTQLDVLVCVYVCALPFRHKHKNSSDASCYDAKGADIFPLWRT